MQVDLLAPCKIRHSPSKLYYVIMLFGMFSSSTFWPIWTHVLRPGGALTIRNACYWTGIERIIVDRLGLDKCLSWGPWAAGCLSFAWFGKATWFARIWLIVVGF